MSKFSDYRRMQRERTAEIRYGASRARAGTVPSGPVVSLVPGDLRPVLVANQAQGLKGEQLVALVDHALIAWGPTDQFDPMCRPNLAPEIEALVKRVSRAAGQGFCDPGLGEAAGSSVARGSWEADGDHCRAELAGFAAMVAVFATQVRSVLPEAEYELLLAPLQAGLKAAAG